MHNFNLHEKNTYVSKVFGKNLFSVLLDGLFAMAEDVPSAIIEEHGVFTWIAEVIDLLGIIDVLLLSMESIVYMPLSEQVSSIFGTNEFVIKLPDKGTSDVVSSMMATLEAE